VTGGVYALQSQFQEDMLGFLTAKSTFKKIFILLFVVSLM